MALLILSELKKCFENEAEYLKNKRNKFSHRNVGIMDSPYNEIQGAVENSLQEKGFFFDEPSLHN
jgi:hypothetical protein